MEAQEHSQQFIFQSEKGIRKQENQDNFLIINEDWYNIYAIFDGVGSALNSKKGTELAKTYIEKNYKKYIQEDKICVDKLMYSCNEYILRENIEEAFTTYCIVIIFKNSSQHIVYSTMGDTRVYAITNQYIEQVSTDDRLGSYKNVVTKCLGMNYLTKSDFTQNFIEKNKNNILMCSDGFYSFLEDDRMKFFEVFNRKNLKTVKNNLDSVIANKNLDDSTYVFIR